MSSRSSISSVFLRLMLASLVLLSACTAAPGGDASTHVIPQSIEKPTDARGLLRNIRRGLDDGLFLLPAFYTDENFARLFGSSASDWITHTDETQYVSLRGLEYLPARNRSSSRIHLLRTKRNASMAVSCSCELRIADIEAVFGKDRREVTDERERLISIQPPSIAAPPVARDPMGNKRVTYEVHTAARWHGELSVVFDPYGRVRTIEAKQRD